jgi:tRNA A37 threonylcarbamoyladenosine dehydratase
MCRERQLPVITTGAAGGRRDPAAIEVIDLAFSSHDRLLQYVRRSLRRRHGFPRGDKRFGIEAVVSREPVVYAHPDGSVCHTREADPDLRLDCDRGYGSATFVTGVFGFVAASRVVAGIAMTGSGVKEKQV